MKLYAVPTTFNYANKFVNDHHRHCGPVQGAKFVLAVGQGKDRDSVHRPLEGVAIAGRPSARLITQDALQISRVCVREGAPRNACSFLISRCCRIAAAMGYTQVITYTMEEESGVSLQASGFQVDGYTPAKGWKPRKPSSGRLLIDVPPYFDDDYESEGESIREDIDITAVSKTRWIRVLK